MTYHATHRKEGVRMNAREKDPVAATLNSIFGVVVFCVVLVAVGVGVALWLA